MFRVHTFVAGLMLSSIALAGGLAATTPATAAPGAVPATPATTAGLVTALTSTGAPYARGNWSGSAWVALGGQLAWAPAAAATNGAFYLVGATSTGQLYAQLFGPNSDHRWHLAAPSWVHCLDPGFSATPTSPVYQLGCRGSDGALWHAQWWAATNGLPYFTSLSSLGGRFYGGPAVTVVPFAYPTVFTVRAASWDSAGDDLWARKDTSGSGWYRVPMRCGSDPATGMDEYQAGPVIFWTACRDSVTGGLDVSAYDTYNNRWLFNRSFGGHLVGSVGTAAHMQDGATFFGEGLDGAVWTISVGTDGTSTGWTSLGGKITGGVNAAGS